MRWRAFVGTGRGDPEHVGVLHVRGFVSGSDEILAFALRGVPAGELVDGDPPTLSDRTTIGETLLLPASGTRDGRAADSADTHDTGTDDDLTWNSHGYVTGSYTGCADFYRSGVKVGEDTTTATDDTLSLADSGRGDGSNDEHHAAVIVEGGSDRAVQTITTREIMGTV